MRKETEHRGACPVCASRSFKAYRLGLWECEDCGIVLSPRIWEPLINERMEDEWFDDGYGRRISSFWVDWFEKRNNRRTLNRLAGPGMSGGRLLDVGVGSGSFLAEARDGGYQVTGCDLSEPISADVRRRIGVAVHCGPLETIPHSGSFDFVVLNHVLEHVQDPVGFLKEVERLLSPGGVVHIACPNLSCWQSLLSGWTSYEPYHLTYFKRATLERVAGLAGLQRMYASTHDSFSGWFLAVARTSLGVNRGGLAVERSQTSRLHGLATKDRKPLLEHTYRIASVLVGAVTWPLRRIQGMLGHGDELVCLARKPL